MLNPAKGWLRVTVTIVTPYTQERLRFNVTIVIPYTQERLRVNVSIVTPYTQERLRFNVTIVIPYTHERLRVNVTIVTPYTQGRLRVNDVPAVWKVITHIHCPTVNSLFLSFSLSLPLTYSLTPYCRALFSGLPRQTVGL